ncbi:DUF1254 domain-containing protein [Arthrobacter sp. 2MCAF14]|uniref:DUF1254 domain-containing protein n=1 Tax=Arthrobacter sp. 2MCAF14 TaxID=3232982 RepID=UPI003F8FD440
MNRLILKYGTTVTIVILAVFAWVIYRRVAAGGVDAIVLLAVTAVIVWVLGAFVFIYFWPRITVGGFKRIVVKHGLGGGPVPVNTLYAVPESPSQSASSGSVIATGTDDVLYLGGWLDVKAGPRVLHVPEMDDRYYSVQFTDPASGANFAYVGKRTTGTGPGDFILCEPNWDGETPAGMARIDIPHHAALLIGRVFIADEDDRGAAYALAKQIQLTPLGRP